MSERAPGLSALDDECIAFSYYLIRQPPNDYVLDKYREAHSASDLCLSRPRDFFDQLLLATSARHPAAAKLVDSYTAVFFKRATVRKKWVLLLAILESCALTSRYFDVPDSHNKWALAIRMLWQGAAFLLTLCLSILLFLPLHLGARARAKLFHRSA